MKSLINIYDITANFWDVNPKFKVLDIFGDLYRNDKSKKKVKSSIDMWFISGLIEKESSYSDMQESPEDRNGQCRTISRDITKHYGDENEDWWYENEERLKAHYEAYLRLTDTPATRSLRRWEKKLEERDQVLADTEYQVGLTDDNGKLVGSNVAVLDKMLVDTPKVWDLYFKIQKALDEEKTGTAIRGEGHESPSDTGEM
jgi:hypothetical protein